MTRNARTLIFGCCLLLFAGLAAPEVRAQRTGVVDSQLILENMPEYKAVQKEVDELSTQWEKEVEEAYKKIDAMYNDYRAREVLMTNDDKKRAQDEIINAEKKAKELQGKRFGSDGDMFKLREEKMRPIQEKVFKAIEDVAKEKKVSLMLDRAGAVSILYAESSMDYSKAVASKLGISIRSAAGASPAAGEGGDQ